MVTIALGIALVVLLTLHVYGAAFATWHLNKSSFFEPAQRYAQYAIIWLIPILGTAFVLNMLGNEVKYRRPGWVPWLDHILLATFVSSADSAIELAALHEHSDSTNHSSGDGGGKDDSIS